MASKKGVDGSDRIAGTRQMRSPDAPAAPGSVDGWIAAALAAIVVLLRLPGLGHPFILFDDYAYVTGNPIVNGGWTLDAFRQSLGAIVVGNWHPVTIWSHMTDVELWGMRAGAHVMTSVVLHAINAALLFLLFRRMDIDRMIALAAGAIFALHPAHVESYAWISERKDVLAALLFLVTLHLWRSWVVSRSRSAWAAALAVFALALMAKPVVVTLPPLLLVLDWLRPGPMPPLRARIVEKIPFFLLSAVASVVTIIAQHAAGAVRSAEITGLGERLENVLYAMAWYPRTWLVPDGLALFHPPVGHAPFALILDAVFIGSITVIAWKLRRKDPAIPAGWFWFLGMLVPVSGIVQVGPQSVADRYLYLPAMGLLLALASAASLLLPTSRKGRVAMAIAASVWIGWLAIASQKQFALWKSPVALFEQIIERHPRSAFGHQLLGLAHHERREWSAAEENLRMVILLQTGGELRRGAVYDTWIGQTHVKLSEALRALGRSEEAVGFARRGAILESQSAAAWLELSLALASAGMTDEAVEPTRRATALDPQSFDAHFHLGVLLALRGEDEQAVNELRHAAALRPEAIAPRIQLALSYVALERIEEAIEQLEEAQRIDRAAANLYLERSASFRQRPDNLERYLEYLRARRRDE